jgi:solute carrier family 38 (sodium-coupled neutral amino acid transporter), member 11
MDISMDSSKKSDINGAVVNLINSIVGAGIVAIPYAVMQCGFFSGIFLLLFLAYAIYESMIILVDCGIKTKTENLEELCLHLFGVRGYYFASVFMFLYSYGSMVAILVVIGDIVPFCVSLLLGIDISLLGRNTVIIVVASCFILPLCLLRDLASLSVASLFSLMALFVLVSFVVVFGQEVVGRDGTFAEVADLTVLNDQLTSGIGTLSFHYVCQHSVLLIFQSLKNPTLPNWKRVASISMMTVLSLSLLMGIGGVLCFAHSTKSNILNNFPSDRKLYICASYMYIYANI